MLARRCATGLELVPGRARSAASFLQATLPCSGSCQKASRVAVARVHTEAVTPGHGFTGEGAKVDKATEGTVFSETWTLLLGSKRPCETSITTLGFFLPSLSFLPSFLLSSPSLSAFLHTPFPWSKQSTLIQQGTTQPDSYSHRLENRVESELCGLRLPVAHFGG